MVLVLYPAVCLLKDIDHIYMSVTLWNLSWEILILFLYSGSLLLRVYFWLPWSICRSLCKHNNVSSDPSHPNQKDWECGNIHMCYYGCTVRDFYPCGLLPRHPSLVASLKLNEKTSGITKKHMLYPLLASPRPNRYVRCSHINTSVCIYIPHRYTQNFIMKSIKIYFHF